MNETKIDWSDLHLFLAVARGGGLAAGSALSGLSAPSLGRHMVVLEQAVGEALFRRLPRGYELTEPGRSLLAEAEAVEEQVLRIERRYNNQAAQVPICISAGTWMTRFLAQHLQTVGNDMGARLIFRAAEVQHHIGRREATIGLRNRRPDEEALVARKTTRVGFAPYATPTAAKRDDWIAVTAQTTSANWVRVNRKDNIRYEVTNPRSLLDLALQNAGHAILPCFVGDCETELVRTGAVIDTLSHDQWLVVHGEDRHQPAVRRTVDRIAKLIVSMRPLFEGKESPETGPPHG